MDVVRWAPDSPVGLCLAARHFRERRSSGTLMVLEAPCTGAIRHMRNHPPSEDESLSESIQCQVLSDICIFVSIRLFVSILFIVVNNTSPKLDLLKLAIQRFPLFTLSTTTFVYPLPALSLPNFIGIASHQVPHSSLPLSPCSIPDTNQIYTFHQSDIVTPITS